MSRASGRSRRERRQCWGAPARRPGWASAYPERVPKRKRLTHLDDRGAARMVDVAEKASTVREALAECFVRMAPATLRAVKEGTPKGDALQVARVAGIMAAKRTSELIPLCHPLPLTSVTLDFEFVRGAIRVLARARVVGQTGVEMEALTAASVAGLTLIDMTKGIERGVYLESVRLLEKSGGRSGTWKRTVRQTRCRALTSSPSAIAFPQAL